MLNHLLGFVISPPPLPLGFARNRPTIQTDERAILVALVRRRLDRVARQAQALQVGLVIRAAFGERDDVINLLRCRQITARLAMNAKRIRLQDARSDATPDAPACAWCRFQNAKSRG